MRVELFPPDSDTDRFADIAYRVRFSAFKRGAQTATLYRADGPQAAGTADGGQLIVDGAPVSIGREARVFAPCHLESGHRGDDRQLTSSDYIKGGRA